MSSEWANLAIDGRVYFRREYSYRRRCKYYEYDIPNEALFRVYAKNKAHMVNIRNGTRSIENFISQWGLTPILPKLLTMDVGL